VSLSPSPFSLYPNTSPSSGYLQPQARVQKPTPISLSPSPPVHTSTLRPELSSVVILESPIATQQSQRTSATNISAASSPFQQGLVAPHPAPPMVLDPNISFSAPPSLLDEFATLQEPLIISSSVVQSQEDRSTLAPTANISSTEGNSTLAKPPRLVVPPSQTSPSSPSHSTSTDATGSLPFDATAHPPTPTTQNTSLEADMNLTSTQEVSQFQAEVDVPSEFDTTFLNFEEDPSSSKSEKPEPANYNPQANRPVGGPNSQNESELSNIDSREAQPFVSKNISGIKVSSTSQATPTPTTANLLQPTETVARTELDEKASSQSHQTTTATKSGNSAELDADWNSFPLGPTFRKGASYNFKVMLGTN
jgi:hypothetical protein